MNAKRTPVRVTRMKRRESGETSHLVARRQALKGLGALALSLPSLASFACGSDASPGAALDGDGEPASDDSSQPDAATSSPAEGRDAGTGTVAQSRDGGITNSDAGVAQSGPAQRPDAGASSADASTSADAALADASSLPASPMFDDAARCTLTTTDIEGPFYIDEDEFPDDPSMIRSDVREGLPGVEFRLSFRLLDANKSCAPIADAELYIWHCNADGLYSGFSGQDPTKPYSGPASATPSNNDRFCRGIQRSDSAGVASFVTLYPGWYAGRPIHVHLMARIAGATQRLITTQLYFPAAFTVEVHSSEPAYMARAAAIPAGSKNPPSGNPTIPTLTHTKGLVVGTLNVIVKRA